MENNIRVARTHRALSWLYGVLATLFIIAGVAIVSNGKVPDAFALLLAGLIFCVAFGLFHHFVAKGARNRRPWANIASRIIGLFMLFGFPLGTLIGLSLLRHSNWKPTRRYSGNLTDGWPTKPDAGNNS